MSGVFLVLGSKPDPILPPRAAIDIVACANASAYSAARAALPTPAFTVMSALLSAGKPAHEPSLQALEGLQTRTVFHLPRGTRRSRGAIWRIVQAIKQRKLRASQLRRRLAQIGFTYERMIAWPYERYVGLLMSCCSLDDRERALLASKRPSTGVFAVMLALLWERSGGLLTDGGFAKPGDQPSDPRPARTIVLGGFDFGLAHAYGPNPLASSRGHDRSLHAHSDIIALNALAARHQIMTTEPAVCARTLLRLWQPSSAEAGD